jgi:hypothetical protein
VPVHIKHLTRPGMGCPAVADTDAAAAATLAAADRCCTAGDSSSNQRWTSGLFPGTFFAPNKQAIRSPLNDLCWSANTAPGASVTTMPCDGQPDKLWTIGFTGELRSSLGDNSALGKCIELSGTDGGEACSTATLAKRTGLT